MDEGLREKVGECYLNNDWKGVITLLKTDGTSRESIEFLADAYYEQKDYKAMKPWYLKGIALESTICMHHLARYYEVCEPNQDLMQKYFKQAIALNDAQSMCDYGAWLGENGNREKARMLWLRGAQLGSNNCCRNINQTLLYSFDAAYAAQAEPYLDLLNRQRLIAAEDNHEVLRPSTLAMFSKKQEGKID